MRKPSTRAEFRSTSKNFTSNSQNSYMRAEIIKRNINEKIGLIQDPLSEDSDRARRRSSEMAVEFEDQQAYADKISNKKKAVSFEGAQYRRVRKLAEEHNRRHYSVYQTAQNKKEDDTLIRGLIGMNNLIEIDRLHPRKKAPFFPSNQSTGFKNRKNSVEMGMKRQARVGEYTSPRLLVNGAEQEVKCLGKQIF